MDFFFTCHYSQENLCQVFRLRFWPETKNETTVPLVFIPWPQFHILYCAGQWPPAPLKHSQAWFSFLSPIVHCWPAAVNLFSAEPAEAVNTGQMSFLGCKWTLLTPSVQPLEKAGCSEKVSIRKQNLKQVHLQQSYFLWGKALSDCKLENSL